MNYVFFIKKNRNKYSTFIKFKLITKMFWTKFKACIEAMKSEFWMESGI
jgi:hypothetical protein